MSTWTRRRLTLGRKRSEGRTTGTGWWEARSPTPGSPVKISEREKKSSQEIPLCGWVEPVWHAGPDVLQW